MDAALERFARDYADHRAAEGRDYRGPALFDLPYLKDGPFARQWQGRACTFDTCMSHVLRPAAARLSRPLSVLDLGAGNGWMSYRIAAEGHDAHALDIRDDRIDGLGAATAFTARFPDRIRCLVAPFDAIPLDRGSVDIALFNASIHYAIDLSAVLAEAQRVVRRGGAIAILDSPFYACEADGLAMVAEKKHEAKERFGNRATALMALPFIEFLTRERIARAAPALDWQRIRVRYPLHYELRGLRAALFGQRRPSRFDLWVAKRA
jgi:SAM-dependent methyltransferase